MISRSRIEDRVDPNPSFLGKRTLKAYSILLYDKYLIGFTVLLSSMLSYSMSFVRKPKPSYFPKGDPFQRRSTVAFKEDVLLVLNEVK